MTEEHNPFQSPEAPPTLADDIDRRRRPPFASGRVRAVFTIVALGFVALFDVAHIGCYSTQYSLLDHSQRVGHIDRAALRANYEQIEAVRTIRRIALLGATAAFLAWVHRAYCNLPALGIPALSTTPGWAVGFYFMPLLNLFMPYAVMAEIWRYSDPIQAGAVRRSTSSLVGVWWGVFVASRTLFFWIDMQVLDAPRHQSIDQLNYYVLWSVAAAAVELLAAILAILLIWKIDRNQLTTHALAEAQGEATIS